MASDSPPPAWRLSKRGNTEAECEDAYAVARSARHFAIADGATESAFAYLWAGLLVEEFVRNPITRPHLWTTWLGPLQQEWLAEAGKGTLPWYVQSKVQEGAFATFLGLSICGPRCRQRRWRAIAVGDSCLFQVRNGQLVQAFPLQRSDEFGSAPWLVGSRARPGLQEQDKLKGMRGSWEVGDHLWMMTDALAQWFLRQVEEDLRPWEAVERLLIGPASAETFASWIEDLRDKEGLRNDDVTLVAVRP